MTERPAPKEFEAQESGETLRGKASAWTRDTVVAQIIVTPPVRSDGVASMLVALGDAGIGVTQVVPTNDEDGMYRISVNVSSSTAAKVLIGIGCVVNGIQSPEPGYSDQISGEQDGLPLEGYV